jgi:hypothetical protein
VCNKEGRFCLVDFGAVRAKLAKSGGSTVAGTFGFMAPEQFQGRALPQSDIYGIGATAIAMLTGQQPEDLPHKGLKIDVRAALGKHAPDELVEALSAMLEPDPDVRPATLDRVLERLRRVGRNETKKDRKRREQDEKERERRSEKKERKRHRSPRDRIRERIGRPHHPLELGPPRLVAKIALRIAQLAVLLSVVFFVPLLLATLSLVFGKPLRVAAGKVRQAGFRALRKIRETRDEALGYAGERVAFPREELQPEAPPQQVRVEPAPAARQPARTPEMEEFDVALEELEAEREAAAAMRKGSSTR